MDIIDPDPAVLDGSPEDKDKKPDMIVPTDKEFTSEEIANAFEHVGLSMTTVWSKRRDAFIRDLDALEFRIDSDISHLVAA